MRTVNDSACFKDYNTETILNKINTIKQGRLFIQNDNLPFT